jgi:L-fuculose-phosphate aldolase
LTYLFTDVIVLYKYNNNVVLLHGGPLLLSSERELIVDYGKKMVESGLVIGTGGNISIYNRDENLIAITPGSRDYSTLKPEDIIIIDLKGSIVDGNGSPSSEWALHTIFYKNREDISSVVHTHSFYASSLSCMEKGVPAIHYLIASAGGAVSCAPYATFGTAELADKALFGMKERRCVLLARHGLVSAARSLEKAYAIAGYIEYIAGLYLTCLSAGKDVEPLSMEEIERLNREFVSYQ